MALLTPQRPPQRSYEQALYQELLTRCQHNQVSAGKLRAWELMMIMALWWLSPLLLWLAWT